MRRLPNIKPHSIRGRRRYFDHLKKGEFRDLVAAGASLEEAAEAMDVSIRTVQREMKHDEDFDHEVRLALQSTPEPEKLLKGHARTHWRAAAWLAERTDPERFGRRPPMSASPFQMDHALRMMLEAALAATPPEFRSEMYRLLGAASDQAFQWVFPNYGPWGNRVKTELPKTPLVTLETIKAAGDPHNQLHVTYDEHGNAFTFRPPPATAMPPQAKGASITSAPAALLPWHMNEPTEQEKPPAQAGTTASAQNPNPNRNPDPLEPSTRPTQSASVPSPTPTRLVSSSSNRQPPQEGNSVAKNSAQRQKSIDNSAPDS